MEGAAIWAKVWQGYGKAALYTGASYTQYRPTSAFMPMAAAYGTQYAIFDAGNYVFAAPQEYAKATWRALVDGRYTQPFDILTGISGTYFIASQDPLLPIFAVRCNEIVDVWRPATNPGMGAIGYGGDAEETRVAVMTGWPASILQGSHTPEKSDVGLPGDARMPWKMVLMPAFPGVLILTNDYITDGNGVRYQVSDAELTNLGWRIAAIVRES